MELTSSPIKIGTSSYAHLSDPHLNSFCNLCLRTFLCSSRSIKLRMDLSWESNRRDTTQPFKFIPQLRFVRRQEGFVCLRPHSVNAPPTFLLNNIRASQQIFAKLFNIFHSIARAKNFNVLVPLKAAQPICLNAWLLTNWPRCASFPFLLIISTYSLLPYLCNLSIHQ